MKKYMICALAIVIAVASSSFTAAKNKRIAKKNAAAGYIWFDYYGGLLQQGNPYYYYVDADNMPDCPPALGLVNCEVLANSLPYDPDHPDVSTIVASIKKFLL